MYGDDLFYRYRIIYDLFNHITLYGERVFFETDFGMLKRMVDRCWDTNNIQAMQRILVHENIDRDLVRCLIGDTHLAGAIKKIHILHVAARKGWSDRFVRALGLVETRESALSQLPYPEKFMVAMSEMSEINAEQQSRLQALLGRYVASADIEALRPLADNALGHQFLIGTRRVIRYLAEHPKLFARPAANIKKVVEGVLSSPEMIVAAGAHEIMRHLRNQVRQNRESGTGHRLCSPTEFNQSITSFAQALKIAHVQQLLGRDDIENMSSETFTALPGWALLAAVRRQVERQVPTVMMNDIREEVFHRAICRSSVEKLLVCINAIDGHAERLTALDTATRALVTAEVSDTHPTIATLVTVAKRVSSEMLSGERQLFSGLCAQAYDKFSVAQGCLGSAL